MVGFIERLAVAARYTFTGQVPDAANWFGPLDPLEPNAPPDVAGRRFDFREGTNLDTRPRTGEGIAFHELRALADNCSVVRLVIETRKDQLGWRKFEIRPTKDGGAKADDPDIKKIETFLQYPDKEHDWETWLRALVEEMLVIDATTIYPRYARGGDVYSLDIVDGSTIKRVIDPWGRRPMPPDPAYQQILKGLPAIDYTADQLLYVPRNYRVNKIYGMSPVEQIIIMINIALRREWHKLQFYTEGTVPDALAGVPDTWNVNQISEFQDYMDTLLEKSTGQRRKIRFVPAAIAKAFIQTKEGVMKDEFDEWIARFVCYAFSVSPQWAVKQMNRSTAESADQQAQEEGLAPLQSWIKRVMTRIIAEVFKRPDLEFTWSEDEAVDAAEQATIDDTNLKNGSSTINQVRERRGEDPLPDGDQSLIYTGAGAVKLSDVVNPPAADPLAPPLNQTLDQDEGGSSAIGHNGGPPMDDDETPAKPKGKGGAAAKPKPGKQQPPQKGGKMTKAEGDDGSSEDEAASLWDNYFANQKKRVTKLVASSWQAPSDDTQAPVNDPDQLAQAAIDASATEAEREALTAAITSLLIDEGENGIAAGVSAVATAIANGQAAAGIVMGAQDQVDITNLANPGAVKYAEEHAAELVTQIDETTRNQLRNLIVQAQKDGWSTKRLVDEIQQLGAFDKERAQRIAKYELDASSTRGNLASWIETQTRLGLHIKKATLLGLNENHCPVCLSAANAGPIELTDSWEAGYAPPFHLHCECDLIPVVEPGQK